MRRRAAALLVSVVAVAGTAPGAAGQDIPAVAEMRGLPVPAAYVQRVSRDSTAFTLPNGLFRTGADGVAQVSVQSGTHRMLMVPTLFADTPEPWLSAEELQRIVFDGPAPRGTLTEAYREFSRGALTVTGTVVPWVRTDVSLAAAVGDSYGLGDESRLGDHLMAALSAVDATVDFGLYDNDGPDGVPNSGDDDGWVDAIAFEFLEVAASCGGPGVWPHRWGLGGLTGGVPFRSDDLRAGSDTLHVGVNGYIIQSAVDCTGEEAQDASTIAHEYGHVLGLPDYYHPTDPDAGSFGRRWVLGCWGLMAAGAWGCGEHGVDRGPFGPTHLSARSKYFLDWVRYVVPPVGLGQELVLGPVQATGEAIRVPLDDQGRESLLLEYRTREGFDAELPAEGVLVYRLDYRGVYRPDVERGQSYFLTLVERDGDGGLLRNSLEGGDRGVAGDVWGVGPGPEKLHGLTTPGTRRLGGASSGVTLHDVRVEDGVARIVLSRAPEPGLALPDEALLDDGVNPVSARLWAGGGTMPYSLQAELPEGLEAELDVDAVHIRGVPREEGDVLQIRLSLVDAAGLASDPVSLPLLRRAWEPEVGALVQPFLGARAGPTLTEAERAYLDFRGNRNDGYDVGDLRAWLRNGTKGAPR